MCHDLAQFFVTPRMRTRQLREVSGGTWDFPHKLIKFCKLATHGESHGWPGPYRGIVMSNKIVRPRRGLVWTSNLTARLIRDRGGNTMLFIAAALAPMLGLVGGAIDIGRGYLAQTRLQQACDAGVLAARKSIGSALVTGGTLPASAKSAGMRFFNLNFRSNSYGTANRTFEMALEDDYSVSGEATVDVPTTIMRMFGQNNIPVEIQCEARLNFSNTDIMMVLDTTGSMALTNSGDSQSRLAVLKDTVLRFFRELEANKSAATRIRYGFVPYSTNVNVGGLLESDWIVDQWSYQTRKDQPMGTKKGTRTYSRNTEYKSGTKSGNTQIDSYPATWHATGATEGGTTVDENENVIITPGTAAGGYYTCDTPAPPNTLKTTDTLLRTENEPFAGPPKGTRKIEYRQRTRNGDSHSVSRSGSTCRIYRTTYTNYVETYEKVTDPTETTVNGYLYKQMKLDVSAWKSSGVGCIEERQTYLINDYNNVDLSRALDLDLDLVPTSDDSTKWAPMLPDAVFARSMKWDGSGSFTTNAVSTTTDFVSPAGLGLANCPAAAMALDEITESELSSYLGTLTPTGQTYHDIGMIWGGRLLSKDGLFATQNADQGAKPTRRHMIFLTDGETAPLDLSYSSYGLEPLDQRRWSPSSPFTLTQTVEKRFAVACREVRKRNITVWVIGFGTAMTDMLRNCAGEGHWFQADDAGQLNEAFSAIAKSMGDLRISR